MRGGMWEAHRPSHRITKFQKKEHPHHSVICVSMFFPTGHQTEKKITPPHSSPSLLFAFLVKILKIGVLTGRSVKAIPVGGKILELKRQRIFFPCLPRSLTWYKTLLHFKSQLWPCISLPHVFRIKCPPQSPPLQVSASGERFRKKPKYFQHLFQKRDFLKATPLSFASPSVTEELVFKTHFGVRNRVLV